VASLSVLKRLHDLGVNELRGFLLYEVSTADYNEALAWLEKTGLAATIEQAATKFIENPQRDFGKLLDGVVSDFVDRWQGDAGLKTYGQAVADSIAFYLDEGRSLDITVDEWNMFAATASHDAAREKARALGIDPVWDWELPRAPEGYYPVRGGIEYAIARSLAVAPFADLIWMETKTANLDDAREFAAAIHGRYPQQMLAYNLSPSFSWDTTGMTDEEMTAFPSELGRLGYVFNFITYGGHQVDGLASDEFATALREDGMLALARLQRKLRLLESPYRLPQTLVGGPRADGALMAVSGGTATTKAMGKGSTQFQHLVQTEVPPSVLAGWLATWSEHHQLGRRFTVDLKPHTSGAELLALTVRDDAGEKAAELVFATIQDRRGRNILSVRDQSTLDTSLRRKRLMTLIHLFLIHRYQS
ncbi:MAG: isocitrate lyase, partial [Xanthomonadales bacterium]|nr:isocitrate lyase [Xanthomonadales bacterium]